MGTSETLGAEPRQPEQGPATLVGLWLRATVLDRPVLREAILARIYAGEGMCRDEVEFCRAAMELAVRRYFPADYDVRQVSAFVARSGRIYGPKMPDALEMEALIRACLGEPDVTINDIALGSLLKIGSLVTSRIVRELSLPSHEVDVMLVRAEQIAAERGWHPAVHDGSAGT
jgi:hypothetical protein